MSLWSGQRDSNPRVSAWEADALPLGDARVGAHPITNGSAISARHSFSARSRNRAGCKTSVRPIWADMASSPRSSPISMVRAAHTGRVIGWTVQ